MYFPSVLPALATILLAIAPSVTAVTALVSILVAYETPPLHPVVTVVSIQVTQVAPEAYFPNSTKALSAVFKAASVSDARTGVIITVESGVAPYALTEVW